MPVITDGMWKLCPYVSAGVHRGMHLKMKVVSMIRFATRRDRLEGPGGGHDVKKTAVPHLHVNYSSDSPPGVCIFWFHVSRLETFRYLMTCSSHKHVLFNVCRTLRYVGRHKHKHYYLAHLAHQIYNSCCYAGNLLVELMEGDGL